MMHLTNWADDVRHNLVSSSGAISSRLLVAAALLLMIDAIGLHQTACPASATAPANYTTMRPAVALMAGEQQDELMQINAKTNNTTSSVKSTETAGGELPAELQQKSSPPADDSSPQSSSEPVALGWPTDTTLPEADRQPASAAAAAAELSRYKLPSWFNYNAFKRLYGKQHQSRFLNELHKRIYLETALKVFEQRALYRVGRHSSLASVNELSDLTSEQLDEFRRRHEKVGSNSTTTSTRRPPTARDGNGTEPAGGGEPAQRQRQLRLPDCCSYDQAYAEIIALLSSATSSNDTALSRALVDELEQRSLVDDEQSPPVGDVTPAPSQVAVGTGFRQQPAPELSKLPMGRTEPVAVRPRPDDGRKPAAEELKRRNHDDDDQDRRRAVSWALDKQIGAVRAATLRHQNQAARAGAELGETQKSYRQQKLAAAATSKSKLDSSSRQAANGEGETRAGRVIEQRPASWPRELEVTDGLGSGPDSSNWAASERSPQRPNGRAGPGARPPLTHSTGHKSAPIGASQWGDNDKTNLSSVGGELAADHLTGTDERRRPAAPAHPQPQEPGASSSYPLEEAVQQQLEDAIRAQLAEQLSPNSPIGRALNKQLSDYFGQPVEVRANRPGGVTAASGQATTNANAPARG